MSLRRPRELTALAAQWGISPGAVTPTVGRVTAELLELFEAMPAGPAPSPRCALRLLTDGGGAPDDPYNAIVRRCRVIADPPVHGPLAGLRLAVKDSLAIAGVPLTLGAHFLGGFVPDRDATAVDRILGAGAEIVAVANMDALAFTGGGHTSATGPIRNPHDPARAAGGSSGGSAAALHLDGVDAALGTDQSGSIRVPAAWCGVLGLKPTHGRVPYDGIAGIDATIDHVGPLARDADTLARLLDALTGDDAAAAAIAEAPADLEGVRIGLVTEAMGEGTDAAIAAAIEGVTRTLAGLGARVGRASIPPHATAAPIGFATTVEGLCATLSGSAHATGTAAWPELADAIADGFEHRADALGDEVKVALLLGAHLRDAHRGAVYARAQRARLALTAAYDAALAEHDLLLAPTTPAPPLALDDGADPYDRLMAGWGALAHTAPTDLTGHPALSMPAAVAGGLPVGAMLVAPRGADARLVAAARTYERAVGWAT